MVKLDEYPIEYVQQYIGYLQNRVLRSDGKVPDKAFIMLEGEELIEFLRVMSAAEKHLMHYLLRKVEDGAMARRRGQYAEE